MTIRIGIIGTGGMGNTHARIFNELKGVKVTACADIDLARAQAFAQAHKIPKAFDNAKAMLEAGLTDAVSIVTPDAFHCENSLLALKHGMHVLCEKPLATSLADARKMVKAAQKAGKINMVNFSYRNSWAARQIAKEVAAGKIGRVTNVIASYRQCWMSTPIWGDWRTTPGWLWRQDSSKGSAGALGDIGVHLYDLVSFMAGPVKRLHCSLKTYNDFKGKTHAGYTLDANDSCTALLEFDHGAQGMFMCSRYTTGEANTLDIAIHGEKGAYVLRLKDGNSYKQFEACIGADAPKAAWKTIKAPKAKHNHERFIDAIKTGKPLDPTFEDGYNAQKLLDASWRSAESSTWIKIK
jgi:predicted dehydrogenase